MSWALLRPPAVNHGWDRGGLHGRWQWWRKDGSLLRSGSFDRGRQVGEWTTYDRESKPVKITQFGM